MDLKSTLNLPDPDFTIAMKADLPVREPQIQADWKANNVYKQIQDASKGRPKFILHDGPPYTNSPIHLGTALNKCLKDFVVKYKTMRGFHAPYVPGYDNHGLPIEMAVQKKIGKGKPASEMRDYCRKHAEEFIQVQSSQFQRFGIFGDWDNSYATMAFGFEASIIRVFASLAEKGFIYRDLRPTHWSTVSRTALADTELDYQDHVSKAIYVRFPLIKDPDKVFDSSENIFCVIWTTTPWTIPANLAVAFHPKQNYELIEHESGRYLIISELVEKVCGELGWENCKKLKSVKGEVLKNLVFKHPIFDRESIAVMADYVTTEDGTGIVHTAPGHGADDFYTGRKYGLPILCPVDEAGVYTHEALEFSGQHIEKAKETVVNRLQELGNLLKAYDYYHSYPYSDRDRSPVIFRTTEQWFLKVDHNDLRQKAIEEIKKVNWYPPAGEQRISAMVSNRPDWCLSRQRTWGVGIPILYDRETGEPILDSEIMENVAKLVSENGSAAWFECNVDDVLPSNHPHKGKGDKKYRKETDVLDVWFDSGITHLAVLDMRYNSAWSDLQWPADLYLEGSDQHRGWFNSSLMTACAIKGSAPYKNVLTHGFLVLDKGEKMSKSRGNAIEPIDAANRFGADVIRLWASTVDFTSDIPCSEELFKQVGEMYRRIRNTLRFLLANLYDFDPKTENTIISDIDLWAVEKTKLLEKSFCAEFDQFEFSSAINLIHNFCANELSSFYLDAIKDRMYCDAKDSELRRSSQAACYEILLRLNKMIAAVLPHTAEEVYQKTPHITPKSTVFLEEIRCIDDSSNMKLLEKFETLFEFKDRLYVQLESWKSLNGIKDTQDVSVRAHTIPAVKNLLASFGADLPTMLRISWIEFLDSDEEKFEFEESKFLKCERSRLRRPDVEMANGTPLSKRDRMVLGL